MRDHSCDDVVGSNTTNITADSPASADESLVVVTLTLEDLAADPAVVSAAHWTARRSRARVYALGAAVGSGLVLYGILRLALGTVGVGRDVLVYLVPGFWLVIGVLVTVLQMRTIDRQEAAGRAEALERFQQTVAEQAHQHYGVRISPAEVPLTAVCTHRCAGDRHGRTEHVRVGFPHPSEPLRIYSTDAHHPGILATWDSGHHCPD